jgi:hypothetical protein
MKICVIRGKATKKALKHAFQGFFLVKYTEGGV